MTCCALAGASTSVTLAAEPAPSGAREAATGRRGQSTSPGARGPALVTTRASAAWAADLLIEHGALGTSAVPAGGFACCAVTEDESPEAPNRIELPPLRPLFTRDGVGLAWGGTL
jgi:hypothetical protein